MPMRYVVASAVPKKYVKLLFW